ncbi:MAG TPA: hypothetical protein VE987_06045 [Polyangiaceae bacterium]|nr:hypothetical protein [Polyangiaceae bacterium]
MLGLKMVRTGAAALTLFGLAVLPSCSRVGTGTSKALKEAALQCNILAFRTYMPPATAEAIVKQDGEMQGIRQKMDELFVLAQSRFGSKAHRTPHGADFEIAVADSRWAPVFGPQWESLRSTPGPLYFTMNADAYWKEECDVARRFEACLGDRTFCSEADVPGSILQMRRGEGTWRLVLEEQAQERLVKEQLLIRNEPCCAGECPAVSARVVTGARR